MFSSDTREVVLRAINALEKVVSDPNADLKLKERAFDLLEKILEENEVI